MAFGQPRIEYKTNAQMRTMHEAGLVLSRALDVGAEDVAGGDRNNAEAFRDAFRLRALARTRWSDNQHSGHRNSPS
jgi:hypothetical protein